jgi:glucan 1,3-beta-glucosidase
MPSGKVAHNSMKRRRLVIATAIAWLIAIGLVAVAVRSGEPVPVANAPDPRAQCLSYAPYRLPGESPFGARVRVSRERLETDFRLLASRTRCIRTYSVQLGLDQVPAVAQLLGMEVMLGVWIGRDPLENEAELALATSLANRYRDTVKSLIVGNEVLLRREQPVSRMAGYLEQARQRTKIPVTYADVWEFWERNAELARQVDFVTIHILPYWEDDPVGIERAVEHVGETHARIQKAFPGKQLVIGETGWPGQGRMRRSARPGRIEQARFHREFAVAARASGWRYNLIEAFDQPWKRQLEGAMGGAWGLFDSAGEAKFPATGPVAADPNPASRLGAAAAGGALAVCLVLTNLVAGRWRPALARAPASGAVDRWLMLAMAMAVGVTAGIGLEAQWRYLFIWARDPFEAGAILAIAVCGLVLGLAALPGATRSWSGSGSGSSWLDRIWPPVAAFVLFGLAVVAVLLAFDPRYRGFPIALYGPPLVALLIRALVGADMLSRRAERTVLGTVIVACLAVNLRVEGLENTEAWQFAVIAAALVYLLVAGPRRATDNRVSATTPSSRPTAARSYE